MDLSKFSSDLENILKKTIEEKIFPDSFERYAKRLERDLNRIAQARIAERSLNENLSFHVIVDGPKSLAIIPSNAVLFRKLEMGEFNADGSLKTPPHSVLQEIKATIRV